MAKLHHIRQLAVKVESAPGTIATGHIASDLIRVRELSVEQNPQYFERPIHTLSWGHVPRRQENTYCEISFAVELTGNVNNAGGSWTVAPRWGRLLRACGMRESAIGQIGISSPTNFPTQHGEEVGDGSETATTVGVAYTDDSSCFVRGASGSFTGTVTGEDSGASWTQTGGDGNTQIGYAWAPNTNSTDTVTIEFRQDNAAGTADRIIIFGCRGDVTIDCPSQDIALLRFTMQGIYSATDAATGYLDAFAATAYPDFTPPTFVDTQLRLRPNDLGSDWAVNEINYTDAQFTLGNNVTMRQNSNSATGWLAAHIAQRTPNGRFNPDDPGVGTYNIREEFKNNTRWDLELGWGGTIGNTFRIQAPAIELDSVGDGERDEVQSLDLSFRMTRGFESGSLKTEVGVDSELVLFHF